MLLRLFLLVVDCLHPFYSLLGVSAELPELLQEIDEEKLTFYSLLGVSICGDINQLPKTRAINFLLPFGSFSGFTASRWITKSCWILSTPFWEFQNELINAKTIDDQIRIFLLPFGSFRSALRRRLKHPRRLCSFLLPFGSFQKQNKSAWRRHIYNFLLPFGSFCSSNGPEE